MYRTYRMPACSDLLSFAIDTHFASHRFRGSFVLGRGLLVAKLFGKLRICSQGLNRLMERFVL